MTGALYGLVDGAAGGAVFAWLYNFLSADSRVRQPNSAYGLLPRGRRGD